MTIPLLKTRIRREFYCQVFKLIPGSYSLVKFEETSQWD